MSGSRIPIVKVVQHSPCETLGNVAEQLEAVGAAARTVRPFAGESVPARMEEAAGLIVLGGPMGVYEHRQYPFLKQEMLLIEQALKEKKPVLGICLGSQLLAAVLGARVAKGRQKEIGWRTVTLAEEAQQDLLWKGIDPSFMGFHWHGDLFELPRGACLLGSSLLTEHQAYRYGENAYGFLFHVEVTEEIIRGMVKAFPDEMQEAGVTSAEVLEGLARHLVLLQRIGRTVFRRWAGLLGGAGGAEPPEEPALISQVYEEDHDRLDALYQKFQAEKGAGLKQAAGFFESFATGLLRHIAWEEEILFPIFEEKTGLTGVGPTEVMRIEHREIRELLRAIGGRLKQGAAAGAEEAALREVLNEHNCKEERILYPAIDECLSGPERSGVFARMKEISQGGSKIR